MPRIYKKKPGAHQWFFEYSDEDLAAALAARNDGMSYREVEQLYSVPKATLVRKLKCQNPGKIGKPKIFSEEELIVTSLLTCAEWRFPLDVNDLRYLAKSVSCTVSWLPSEEGKGKRKRKGEEKEKGSKFSRTASKVRVFTQLTIKNRRVNCLKRKLVRRNSSFWLIRWQLCLLRGVHMLRLTVHGNMESESDLRQVKVSLLKISIPPLHQVITKLILNGRAPAISSIHSAHVLMKKRSKRGLMKTRSRICSWRSSKAASSLLQNVCLVASSD